MEDQVEDFLKQLAAKLELVLLIPISGEANPIHCSFPPMLTPIEKLFEKQRKGLRTVALNFWLVKTGHCYFRLFVP